MVKDAGRAKFKETKNMDAILCLENAGPGVKIQTN